MWLLLWWLVVGLEESSIEDADDVDEEEEAMDDVEEVESDEGATCDCTISELGMEIAESGLDFELAVAVYSESSLLNLK